MSFPQPFALVPAAQKAPGLGCIRENNVYGFAASVSKSFKAVKFAPQPVPVVVQFAVAGLELCPNRERRNPLRIQTGQLKSAATAIWTPILQCRSEGGYDSRSKLTLWSLAFQNMKKQKNFAKHSQEGRRLQKALNEHPNTGRHRCKAMIKTLHGRFRQILLENILNSWYSNSSPDFWGANWPDIVALPALPGSMAWAWNVSSTKSFRPR